jgi:PST family polysaccharide transporter
MAPAVELPAAEEHTYGQILKSSVLIGGSSVLNIGIGIVRTRAMAVLLGPAGFGLMSLYGSLADLAVSIAGMGVNSSGVRQIAEAAGSGDDKRIARTVTVLRRTTILLGILGAVVLVVFCRQVSALTFGTDEHAGAVALLSLVVLFRLVAAGQGALVQGIRRITDLAKMGVLGALLDDDKHTGSVFPS